MWGIGVKLIASQINKPVKESSYSIKTLEGLKTMNTKKIISLNIILIVLILLNTFGTFNPPTKANAMCVMSVGSNNILSLGNNLNPKIQPNVVVCGGPGGDTTPPSLSISSPSSGATIGGNPRYVSITASASDANGVSELLFYVNGNRICTYYGPSYSCSWDTANNEGSVTITVYAYDNANNGASKSITVTVSNSIKGFVYDGETGQPISGALVTAVFASYFTTSVVADAGGYFGYNFLISDYYYLIVNANGYLGTTVSIHNSDVAPLKINLYKNLFRIQGYVRYGSNDAISNGNTPSLAGYTVGVWKETAPGQLDINGNLGNVVSGTDGKYSIKVQPNLSPTGYYLVRVGTKTKTQELTDQSVYRVSDSASAQFISHNLYVQPEFVLINHEYTHYQTLGGIPEYSYCYRDLLNNCHYIPVPIVLKYGLSSNGIADDQGHYSTNTPRIEINFATSLPNPNPKVDGVNYKLFIRKVNIMVWITNPANGPVLSTDIVPLDRSSGKGQYSVLTADINTKESSSTQYIDAISSLAKLVSIGSSLMGQEEIAAGAGVLSEYTGWMKDMFGGNCQTESDYHDSTDNHWQWTFTNHGLSLDVCSPPDVAHAPQNINNLAVQLQFTSNLKDADFSSGQSFTVFIVYQVTVSLYDGDYRGDVYTTSGFAENLYLTKL
ncbi:MAG: Ig-like domain-containing protein [Candidatus Thorarchaeota archaeon]